MSATATTPRPGGGAADHQQRVQRTALANRLRAIRDCPLVTLAAPAGYGKTTLISQWSSVTRAASRGSTTQARGAAVQVRRAKPL